MGLFDIFKSKPDQEAPPGENELERALRKAASEPAARIEFYQKLLSERLIVLTSKSSTREGEHVLQEDTSVDIVTLADGKIPVFTSTERIFDKGIIKEKVPFLAMKGEDLFNMATGATLILNPYSDHGKELLPIEIEGLLKGTLLTDNHKQTTVERDTEVQIGQPAIYPTVIVRSLNTLFAARPAVRSAYLGWIYDPSSGQPPHLIFALDIDGEKQAIINEAGFTAQQLSQPGDIFDFIQVDHTDGLSDYFLTQTMPFYTRS